MLVVFIAISNRILEENLNLRTNIASTYVKVYNGPPWNEDWTKKSALEELDKAMEKLGFVGVVIDDGCTVGFSWGYKLPENDLARLPCRDIRSKLVQRGLNPDQVFYGADLGVLPEFREQGLGTRLLNERRRLSGNFEIFISRTKNPKMLNLWRKIYGQEEFSFSEESCYKGGRVYVFLNHSVEGG